jgi:hypothetical protein
MRETFFLSGQRQKREHLEEVHKIVMERYPSALREGSVCHYSWYFRQDDPKRESVIVAEAWMSDRMRWWYFKIAEG